MRCRVCQGQQGRTVLDLGNQPASDHFPRWDETSADDPTYPLQMWLCARCGLAQLLTDPTSPEEPRGIEPSALIEQAQDAVHRLVAAGWLRNGMRVVEYGSPHGGAWAPHLQAHRIAAVSHHSDPDAVVDIFGLMHEPDQARALAERAQHARSGGLLLLQYHSLATILRDNQWNALRHGHYAYYSTSALITMLDAVEFVPVTAWTFDLYGGTVLLAAAPKAARRPDVGGSLAKVLADEDQFDLRSYRSFSNLQRSVSRTADALGRWLVAQRVAGMTVYGYGAASRAGALLCGARVNSTLLRAIADTSVAKLGRRMPGTDIRIVSPAEMLAARPDAVLLFVPDLLPEVRRAYPQIEAAGGQFFNVDDLVQLSS